MLRICGSIWGKVYAVIATCDLMEIVKDSTSTGFKSVFFKERRNEQLRCLRREHVDVLHEKTSRHQTMRTPHWWLTAAVSSSAVTDWNSRNRLLWETDENIGGGELAVTCESTTFSRGEIWHEFCMLGINICPRPMSASTNFYSWSGSFIHPLHQTAGIFPLCTGEGLIFKPPSATFRHTTSLV
jgi:hypothetical protein